jgi:hypothetical protein
MAAHRQQKQQAANKKQQGNGKNFGSNGIEETFK